MSDHSRAAEHGTRWVASITLVMMAVEIWAGLRFNSLALLADGWHMSTHALAIGLSAAAYFFSRRYANDARFASGTRKIEVLAAYTSALILFAIAGGMFAESLQALFAPKPIAFSSAIAVAVIGLVVNVASAMFLNAGRHDHSHALDHSHDLNLRSAYLHVIADAATSVFAIVALLGGKGLGWVWLDPVMGILGAGLVAVWAWGLLRDSACDLLEINVRTQVEQNN